jgi:transposase
MMIIGVDYHPSFQQIASLVEETGECGERRLNPGDGEAENFYRDLKARGISVRVGLESTGYSRWFERLLAELGFEVWIGDAAEIKTKRAKKQKTDRQDAQLLLKLLLEERFPRIWVRCPKASKETNEDHSSEWREYCARKTKKGDAKFQKSARKDLTEPTLLEITDYLPG